MYLHDDQLNQVNPMDSFGGHHSFFKLCRLMPDLTETSRRTMKVDCIQDSRSLKMSSNSRISSSTCSKKHLASGTFEGGLLIHNIENPDEHILIAERLLTKSSDGITNCLAFNGDSSHLFIASNDLTTRVMDLEKTKVVFKANTPFAVNALSVNPKNTNVAVIVGDNVDAFIVDYRFQPRNSLDSSLVLSGHKDYSFCCDWSQADDNLLISGNQDGTMRLWDNRKTGDSVYCWNSALGSPIYDINSSALGGPVRNCKFSQSGSYVVWAETLDHVGVVPVEELRSGFVTKHLNVQSIDFIGKCIGLNTCAMDGHDEKLVIGVNDHPLGGILTYNLETPQKLPPFDFAF